MAAHATVFIGGILAGWQYFEHRQETRVARTLELVQRFDVDHYATSRAAVDAFAELAVGRISSLGPTATEGLAPAARADVEARLILSVVYPAGGADAGRLPPPFTDVTGYFGGLEACIERKACDGPTAQAFLGDYAREFWRTFWPVVQTERRGRRPNFARGMEAFVNRQGGEK